MELSNIPFNFASSEHKGETETATWRSCIVEYSAGYKADHWCSRGHILYVISGELLTHLDDGSIFKFTPGISYEVQHDG